jgi:hypothetical protein
MTFIQLIDYETDRPGEIDQTMRTAIGPDIGGMGFVRLEQTQDHDNPRHFVTIVEFQNYEAAMSNSGRPETDQMARELAALCTSGPTYRNLDVQLTMP